MLFLATLNCNGFRNSDKRDILLNLVTKRKYDIILLQETLWDDVNHESATKQWNGEISFQTILLYPQ